MVARNLTPIIKLLNTNLQSFSSGYNGKIHFEGWAFTPPTGSGVTWLRQTTLWAKPRLIGAFSDAGDYREQGIYQVDVFKAKGQGILDMSAVVDSLLQYYLRGTRLSDGTYSVRIEQSYRGTLRDHDPWCFIPVSVEFWAYTPYGA